MSPVYFSETVLYNMFEISADPSLAWLAHRFRTLLGATLTPSEQLGPTELNRIKGFTGHLCHLVAKLLSCRETARLAHKTLQQAERVTKGKMQTVSKGELLL